jgi:hypothetical protein
MRALVENQVRRGERVAWIVAGVALALCLPGWIFSSTQFFHSWWLAWLFWAGIAFGGVPVTTLHFLTGGRWGAVARRPAEAAMLTLPLMAALFLPMCWGVRAVFPWAVPGYFEGRHFPHQQAWLTPHGWLWRSLIYFAAIVLVAYFLRLFSRSEDHRDTPLDASIRSGLGGLGTVVYVFCMNFASTDWVMSLEPQWFSTIFAVIYMIAQFLSALALCVIVVMLLAEEPEYAVLLTPKGRRDLGNLLLAFVIFWAYVSFSQLLIIWSGNLPREIGWYLHRMSGGWPQIAIALAVLLFGLPFALLLSRANKHRTRHLLAIAALVLAANLLHVYWLVVPTFHPEGVRLHLLDLAALIAIGGAWTGLFLRNLRQLPLASGELGREVLRG